MHNSIVRHTESESLAIQFSHGLLDFCSETAVVDIPMP